MAKTLVAYIVAVVAFALSYFVIAPGNGVAAFVVGAAFIAGYFYPRR